MQTSRSNQTLTLGRNASCWVCRVGLLILLASCDRQTSAPASTTAEPSASPAPATMAQVLEEPPVASAPAAPPQALPATGKTAPVRAPIVPEMAIDPAPRTAPESAPESVPGSGVPDVLTPAIATLEAQTQIPVLLPAALPLPEEPIYATTEAAPDRYTINLGYVPDCRGNACMLGMLAARRGTGDYYEVDEPFEQMIALADGTAAYFNPSVCGASCAPPVLEWEYGGARYRLELKNLSPEEALGTLTELANSAIAAGDRRR